ncbi:MAG: hypothetical protein GC159_22515 [Phycisphaera sp.]|nr:hypothetical protein [Phycisphaera sp.]
MFDRISRSWQFAKISYGIVWENKQLMVFPFMSSVAAFVVMLSFALPIWQSGLYERWIEVEHTANSTGAATNDFTHDPVFWILTFAFYFASYFTIVFFNSALTACAMRVIDGQGEEPSVGYGMSMAFKRIGSIAGWAAFAALIGTLIKAIENSNEKAGRIVAGLLGMAWTALTYFVVPIIVMDGVGPIEAFKRSTKILKETWGEALVGNFSLGFLSFLVTLPALLLFGAIGVFAATNHNVLGIAVAVALAVVVLVVVSAMTSAADVVFKALLYNYATGRSVPEVLDEAALRGAFVPKR